MTISPAGISPSPPDLEAYSEAAKTAPDLYVNIEGTQRQVLSLGSTPQGVSVAWLAPDVDTTSLFTRALAQTYGPGVANAIAKEFSLDPAPGKPLASRTVLSALDMAENAKDALSGVDFMTRLSVSAVSDTPIFRQACQDCYIDSKSVTTAQRQTLDLSMQHRFDQAVMAGMSPVTLETAGGWLRELLRSDAKNG